MIDAFISRNVGAPSSILVNPIIGIDNTGLITSSVGQTESGIYIAGSSSLQLDLPITVNPTITNSSGLITASVSKVESGVTISGSSSLQLTTKGATTYTPGTTNQTIASGTYLTGTQTISGNSNLTAGNIKDGVKIFNVTGTCKPQILVAAVGIIATSTLTNIGFNAIWYDSEYLAWNSTDKIFTAKKAMSIRTYIMAKGCYTSSGSLVNATSYLYKNNSNAGSVTSTSTTFAGTEVDITLAVNDTFCLKAKNTTANSTNRSVVTLSVRF